MAWDKSLFITTPVDIPVAPGKLYSYQCQKFWNVSRSRGPDGELIIRPQACSMAVQETKHVVTRGEPSGYYGAPRFSGSDGLLSSPNLLFPFDTDASLAVKSMNRARARFLGSARGSTASMGITLATWKQSRDMILLRTRQLSDKLLSIEREVHNPRTLKRALARFSQDKGNLYLEGIFGWMPLIEDISSAVRIISSETPSPCLIRGSSTAEGSYEGFMKMKNPWVNDTISSQGSCRTTITAMVDVSNHNLWMANRLGVLNVPAIAVDLIPWSWVVGMFWNQSAFVGQLTDTVGLSFRDMSTTVTTRGTSSWSVIGKNYYNGSTNSGTSSFRRKTRTLSRDLPAVRPEVRIPDCSFGLAATGLALLAQRAQKLTDTVQKHTKQIRKWRAGPVTE